MQVFYNSQLNYRRATLANLADCRRKLALPQTSYIAFTLTCRPNESISITKPILNPNYFIRICDYAIAVRPWAQPEVAMNPGRFPKMNLPKCILHHSTIAPTWRMKTIKTLLKKTEILLVKMTVGIR